MKQTNTNPVKPSNHWPAKTYSKLPHFLYSFSLSSSFSYTKNLSLSIEI